MARAGARGATATQMDAVMRAVASDDHAGWMNALEAARVTKKTFDGRDVEIEALVSESVRDELTGAYPRGGYAAYNRAVEVYVAADGNDTLKKIWLRLAPKLLSISTKRSLVVRSPASVLMVTGNSTKKITTSTFDQMPMPNQRMNSGASAIVGVA